MRVEPARCRDRHARLRIHRDGRSAMPGSPVPPALLLAARRPLADPAHAHRGVAGAALVVMGRPGGARRERPDLVPEPPVRLVAPEPPFPARRLTRGFGGNGGRDGRRALEMPAARVVQLAHRVGQAAGGGQGRGDGRRLQLGLLARPREELREPALGLEVAADHHAVVGLEGLRDPVDQRPREAQRVADLAHRRPRPVRDEVADHPRVLGPVALVDVLDHLLPPLRAEVDVDVRVRRPALVDEPLEQQLVADRVHARDPQHVRDDRVRRAPPPLRRDVARLREPHQVPADQEELGEARLLDHVELVGELSHDARRHRVVAALRPLPAQRRQVAERRLSLGHVEAREAVALEHEVHLAARGDLRRGRDPRPPRPRQHGVRVRGRWLARRQREQRRGVLEVRLAVRPAEVEQLGQRAAVPDRGQDVLELAPLGPVVVDVVGDDHGQPELLGQARRLRDEPVVVGEQVVRELEHEAARGRRVAPSEQAGVALRHRPRAFPVARPQPPRQLALPAARQRDQPLGVLGQQRLGELRHRLRPREVGPRHHPAQAPPARRVPGEQHEVRPALPLPDPAVVLLADRAMAGQPGARWTRASGPAFRDEGRLDDDGRPTAGSPGTPGRHHDPAGIRHRRIDELDLHADHRVEAGRLGRRREPDGTVEALVVRDREPGQPELHRARDEVVRCRRAVEEREMAVAVQLGVGGMGHATVLRGAGRQDRTSVRYRHQQFRLGMAQPNRVIARLKAVIAQPSPHPGRRLALELLVRAAAIALAAVVILGLLPTLAEAVG